MPLFQSGLAGSIPVFGSMNTLLDHGIDLDALLLEDSDPYKTCQFELLVPGHKCDKILFGYAVFTFQGCPHDGTAVYLCQYHFKGVKRVWHIAKHLAKLPGLDLFCLMCQKPTLKDVKFFKI
jgi:hypothetical protein